jgi:dTMP kinase
LGIFITFEGGEGTGKSYQSKALYRKLVKSEIPAVLTYEPGGTDLGDAIRRLLKSNNQAILPDVELFLFSACRIQLLAEVICPSLKKGEIVICDRFADSTVAYQGYGRGLDLKVIDSINAIATDGLKPDLTILLDLPAGKGLNRKPGRDQDRFERIGLNFHNKVRNGYLKLAAKEPERWLIVDAALPRAKISNIILDVVTELLYSRQDALGNEQKTCRRRH